MHNEMLLEFLHNESDVMIDRSISVLCYKSFYTYIKDFDSVFLGRLVVDVPNAEGAPLVSDGDDQFVLAGVYDHRKDPTRGHLCYAVLLRICDILMLQFERKNVKKHMKT